jgi:hypothetical protein
MKLTNEQYDKLKLYALTFLPTLVLIAVVCLIYALPETARVDAVTKVIAIVASVVNAAVGYAVSYAKWEYDNREQK